jgi:vacuolar-type H+-ATPase subunit C/Vma6
MARRFFHSRPDSLDAVFCFIKLKQFEEDILTSSAEGLGIGMTSADVFSILGVDS